MENRVHAGLNQPYTRASGRKFGVTVGGAFLVLAGVARWRGHTISFSVFALLGAILLVAGFVAPTALRTVERAWMAVATAISKVTTPVFMGVVYFGILTPIGLVRRMFGANALVRRIGDKGWWIDRRNSPRSALERQF